MKVQWPNEIDGVLVPYGRTPLDLRALVTEGTRERWVAIAALARSSEKDALDCLGELASFPDPYVRRFAIQWIGRHPNGATLARAVIEGLRDPADVVVRTAAWVVTELGLSEARSDLLKLLESESPSTRRSSLHALEKVWSDADFETVVRVFKNDPSEEVQRTAGWTLYRARSANRAPALVELLLTDPLPRHRCWACGLIGEFQLAHFREPIVNLLEDKDGHVRKAALRALTRLPEAV